MYASHLQGVRLPQALMSCVNEYFWIVWIWQQFLHVKVVDEISEEISRFVEYKAIPSF